MTPANAKYSAGAHVEYHPIGGATGTSTSCGKILRVLDHPEPAGSSHHTVRASEEDLRYEIENDHTGKASAVKERNIVGVLEE